MLAPRAALAQASEGPPYPPKVLPYEDGQAIPSGYHLETRAKRSYLLLGASLFGASYLPSALIAAAVVGSKQPDGPRVAPLAIPVVGPFLTIESAHGGMPAGVVLALDGIVQTGGVILFAAGLKIDEPILVFNTLPVNARLSVGPGNVSVVGSF